MQTNIRKKMEMIEEYKEQNIETLSQVQYNYAI